MKVREQDELAVRFAAEASAQGWLKRDVAVLAAVSGGPDSMALLHLLVTLAAQTPMRIVVAHANHQFRGAESDAEEALVRSVAEDWGLPAETAALAVPAYIEETGMNAQSAAREKRYAFLREAAKKHGCSCILLGHHADDQAETVLMRIIRGTGPSGLTGIPQRRKEDQMELIRPLLRITKGELLAYCQRNNVPYAMDSSNVDRHYFRNAVRLDVMPMLETFNPRLKESLARLAEMAAAEDAYMEAETLRAYRLAVKEDGGGYRVERRRFCGLHVALQRRLVKLILSCSESLDRRFDYRLVEDIVSALAAETPAANRLELGGGWEFVREYDEGYLGPARPSPSNFSYPIDAETNTVYVEETGDLFVFDRLADAQTDVADRSVEACFDEDQLVYPLRIRSRRHGDVMEPHGLNGSKKVQDMFVDAKVPCYRRDLTPLLVDGEGRILWIPGLRRSRHALIDADTKKTLRIALQRPQK